MGDESQVRIRPLKNGPVEVAGPVVMVDATGATVRPDESPIYLCRCGHSATKPFCDGTHKKMGFEADGWARPSSRA
jgi:CDGSH-type Zn-finger protein